MDLRALSLLPTKTWVGKTQRHLGHSGLPQLCLGWEGDNDGELASGAVSSGDFLKENYFDEYI